MQESESDLLFKQPPGKMDTQESLLVSQPTFSGISNILLKTGNSDMLVMRNPAVGTQATLRPPKKVSFAPKVEEIAVRYAALLPCGQLSRVASLHCRHCM